MYDHRGKYQPSSKVLADLQSDIRLAERRVKGLTTMVDNLEKSKAEKEALLSAAEQDLKANKGDAEQLAAQVKSLEKNWPESTGNWQISRRSYRRLTGSLPS